MSSEGMLLSPLTLPGYLRDRGLADRSDDIRVSELGGGVSNIVLLVELPGRRWVVKQSLEKLRVKDDWRSERERIFREAGSLHALRPMLGDALPEVVRVDRENFLFIMTAAPSGAIPWKEQLLGRRADLLVARRAALLLARMINSSGTTRQFEQWYSDLTVFRQLRIDPYYRTAAARNPDVQAELRELITDTFKIRTALVHGDYSPKNMLVHGRKVFLIDFEVVHWGDPSFDSGFLLNHLFLKLFHRPLSSPVYLAAVREFWKTLITALGPEGARKFEVMTVRHLGGLMLARIDGKSPVEYIQDEQTKERVRRVAKWILLHQPQDLEEVIDRVLGETRGGN